LSYTYSTLVTALQIEAVLQPTDSNWLGIIPTILDQAEQRIYRDLDLAATIVRDTSGYLSANSRNFTLPQTLGRFVTVKGMNVFGPGGPSTARTQLRPVSIHFIDAAWPGETATSGSSVPQYFAFVSDQQYAVGPAPGSALQMEVIGTIRPTPLSASNTSTFLTNYLSDLFFAACMSAIAGYQRDYGSQADDPKSAMSWETQYVQRLASAQKEELRRKFQSGDWTGETRPAAVAPQG
jgi:hypothetical protein